MLRRQVDRPLPDWTDRAVLAALARQRRQVEQARYHAARAERRYRAVDPDNPLAARSLGSRMKGRAP